MADQPMIISPVDYRAQQIAQSKTEAATLTMDLAPEGGRYLVGGQTVDANGLTVKPSAGEMKALSDAKAFAEAQAKIAHDTEIRAAEAKAAADTRMAVEAEAEAKATALASKAAVDAAKRPFSR